MQSKNLKLFSFILAYVCAAGCTNAEFGGSPSGASQDALKKTGSPGNPNPGALGVPDSFTDDLLESGWVDEESFADFDEEFDTAGNAGNGRGGDEGIFTDRRGAFQSGKEASYAYWQPCDEESFVTKAKTGFSGPEGTYVRVSGSFCPTGAGALTALFIVDFSGSMGSAGAVFGALGNDPTTASGCGRLDATQEILKNLLDEAPRGAAIRAGVLGFSDHASMKLGIRDARDLLDDIEVSSLCGSDGNQAWTNYEAAFFAAKQQLDDVLGNKIIYFISDGAPTRDSRGVDERGQRARASGKVSARALTRAHDDLTMEIIFLGNIAEQDISESYLDELAGSDGNVTLVSDASDLGEAAGGIEVPSIGMKRSSFSARITYPDGKSQNIDLDKINSSKKFGTTFMTMPFPLRGPKGQTSDHKIIIEAKTDEGDDLESIVTLGFENTDLAPSGTP